MDDRTYVIFHGQNPNDSSDYEVMAIEKDLLDRESESDYFLTSQSEIEKMGEVIICGDAHLLSDNFSVK